MQQLGKPKEHASMIAALPFPCIQKQSIVRCNVKVNDPCNQDTIVTRMTAGPLVIYGVLSPINGLLNG